MRHIVLRLTVSVLIVLSLTGFLIINGKVAKKGQFIGVVALEKDKKTLCTGTAVNGRFVITAAHCLDDVNSFDSIRVFDSVDMSGDGFKVCGGVYPKDGALAYDKIKHINDIAVVYLPEEYNPPKYDNLTKPHIVKINLPKGNMQWEKIVGQPVKKSPIFVGYGLNVRPDKSQFESYKVTEFSKSGKAPLITGDKNLQRFDRIQVDRVDDFRFWYSSNVNSAEDAATCMGDSGGPSLTDDGTLIGVTSIGDTKCTSGISTRVDAYLAWLNKAVSKGALELNCQQ